MGNGPTVSIYDLALYRNLTKSEDLASAAAMLSFFRAFGQAAKVAIGGTVFQHQVRKKILGYSFACVEGRGILERLVRFGTDH